MKLLKCATCKRPCGLTSYPDDEGHPTYEIGEEGACVLCRAWLRVECNEEDLAITVRAPRPSRPPLKSCLHTTGWVASADVWEELDGLEKNAEVDINEKRVRLVAGTTSHDKLFEIVNRPCGLERFFGLADAVRFVLVGELVPIPGSGNPLKPCLCPQCGKMAKATGSMLAALDWCTPCMIEMCSACFCDHQERHEADPAYQLMPSDAQLASEHEERRQVAEILAACAPTALATSHGTNTRPDNAARPKPRRKPKPLANCRQSEMDVGE